MEELKPFSSADEGSWRTPAFRQNVVAKIYDFVQKSGMSPSRNSMEMENHVFQKAKTKEEYLGMVARLIIHFRDMNKKSGVNQNIPGLQGPGINQPNNVGAQNTNQSGPGGNQTGTGNNSNNQGIAPDPINALQSLASQGSRNNQMINNIGPQGQMQVQQNNMGAPTSQVGGMQNQMPQNTMNQQGTPQQNSPITASNLHQTLNQRPQLANMQQQLQNKMGPGMGIGSMGNNAMGSNQMPGQMVNSMTGTNIQSQMSNANISGGNALTNQLQGNNPMTNQMVPNQMNPNMPGQMVGPNQMPSQMGAQMNMMHLQRKPGEGMNTMMNPAGSTFQTGATRGTTPSQFLRQSPSPSAPSPAAMGGPSPASMGVMAGPMPSPMSVGSSGLGVGSGGPVGGVASPALQAPSPSSHHPQQQHQHMQQHQRSVGMAPSPSSSLNTPLGVGAAPSPSGATSDDHAYREKVRQLSKYIDPLRRMIERMVNDGENVEKLTKMKNLLDILSHPNKRMPLDTLLKCEVVLEKLDFKRSEGMAVHSQTNPLHQQAAKEHQIFNPLLEVISNTLQSPVSNHTLERTFGPCIEALCGPDIRHMPPPLKKQKIEVQIPDIPDILQGEIARLDSRFKVSLEGLQVSTSTGAIRLIAQLEDSKLPCVPPVSLSVPRDYPGSAPSCLMPSGHYGKTPFLRRVGAALSSRLGALPRKYSLSQLLDTWEMSVRQACNSQEMVLSNTPTTVLMGI